MNFEDYGAVFSYHDKKGNISDHVEVLTDKKFNLFNGNNSKAIIVKSPNSAEMLKKINSNTKYRKFTPKSKAPISSSPKNNGTYPIYLMKQFKGMEFKIPSNYTARKYLPFKGQRLDITQATKDYLYNVAYQYVFWKMSAIRMEKDHPNHYKDSYYNSAQDYVNELQSNLHNFILAIARSCIRAGIDCKDVLRILKDNLYVEGIDEGLFSDGYETEMETELRRGLFENAQATDCCIDYGSSYNYYKTGDSFDDYNTRIYKFNSYKELSSLFGF